MRFPRLILLMSVGLIMVGALTSAENIALTRSGALYRVNSSDNGLMLDWTTVEDAPESSLIPQTTNIPVTAAHLGIDEITNTVYVVWQEQNDDRSSIFMAWYNQGTWFGPTAVAGEDGSIAVNPQLMVKRESFTIAPDNEDEEEFVISTTFLHLTWWNLDNEEDLGVAMYVGIPTLEDGNPDFDSATTEPIGDLLPYGIGCHGIEDARQLAHPKMFIDPESGAVNVFAADFANCLFQIVEMQYRVVDFDRTTKRGRHSIILGRATMMAINPDFPLGSASVKVGHNLSVVVYWDTESAIEYTTVDEDGWSKVLRLELSDVLNHEQAVELVRHLAR